MESTLEAARRASSFRIPRPLRETSGYSSRTLSASLKSSMDASVTSASEKSPPMSPATAISQHDIQSNTIQKLQMKAKQLAEETKRLKVELKTSTTQYREKIRKLCSENSTLNRSVRSLRKSLKGARRRLRERNKEMGSVEAELLDAKLNFASASAELEYVKGSKTSAEGLNEGIATPIMRLETSDAADEEARNEIEKLRLELHAEKAKHEADIASLTSQNEFLRGELASENARMRTEAKSMKKIQTQLVEDLEFLEKEVTADVKEGVPSGEPRSWALIAEQAEADMNLSLEYEERYIDAAMECEMLRGRLGASEIILSVLAQELPEGAAKSVASMESTYSPRIASSPSKAVRAKPCALGKNRISSPAAREGKSPSRSSPQKATKVRVLNANLTKTVATQNKVLEQLFQENHFMMKQLQVTKVPNRPRGKRGVHGGRQGKFLALKTNEDSPMLSEIGIQHLEDRIQALEKRKAAKTKKKKKRKQKKRKVQKQEKQSKAVTEVVPKGLGTPVQEVPAPEAAEEALTPKNLVPIYGPSTRFVSGFKCLVSAILSEEPEGIVYNVRSIATGETHNAFAGWHYIHYLLRGNPAMLVPSRKSELAAELASMLSLETVDENTQLVINDAPRRSLAVPPKETKIEVPAAQEKSSPASLSTRENSPENKKRRNSVEILQGKRRAVRERMRRGSITLDEADKMETEIDAELLQKFMERRSSQTRRRSSILNPDAQKEKEKGESQNIVAAEVLSEKNIAVNTSLSSSASAARSSSANKRIFSSNKKDAAFLFKITRQDTFGVGAETPGKKKSKGLAHSLLKAKSGKSPFGPKKNRSPFQSKSPAASAAKTAALPFRSDTEGDISRLTRPKLSPTGLLHAKSATESKLEINPPSEEDAKVNITLLVKLKQWETFEETARQAYASKRETEA